MIAIERCHKWAYAWLAAWLILNVADALLSLILFRSGGDEFSLIRYVHGNAGLFLALKFAGPLAAGLLLLSGSYRRLLPLLTGIMVLVVGYNLFWVMRFNLWSV
jgi:hypothetical protein